MVLDCSSLTSLFVVILLLLSDPAVLGCPPLFSSTPYPLIATTPPMCSFLLVRVTSCVGPVLTSLVTSPVPVFWSVHVVMLGCVPDADDPPWETEECGVESCSVSCEIFF